MYSNLNNPTIQSNFPVIGTEADSDAIDMPDKMARNSDPQDIQDSSVATLIGVVPEPKPGLEKLSDNYLMAAVADGDRSAFEKLYDRHFGSCFNLAVWFVREPALAEDIVQEVFIKLWSRPRAFSPDRGGFHSWLLTVVHNQAFDKLRQMKSRLTISISPLREDDTSSDRLVNLAPDNTPTSHDQVWAKEVASSVRHALHELSDPQYQTIALAYFGGHSQRQIADRLNQPLGTVKTRTRLALRRLHDLLAAQGALSD